MASKRLLRRPLNIPDILVWASAFREVNGRWPTSEDGPIVGPMHETWKGVHGALRHGGRGLPGGSSLAQLLQEHCGHRNLRNLPPLTDDLLLKWADEYYREHGRWPNVSSGRIPSSGHETWGGVDYALKSGTRGRSGGSTLGRYLAEHRGFRQGQELPPLSVEQILKWSDAEFQRSGLYPNRHSGAIPEAPGETWVAVDMALRKGARRLPGGSSLARLLAEQRGVRNPSDLPELPLQRVLEWIDDWHHCHGRWPDRHSGAIPAAPNETWNGLDHALRRGSRGLPKGLSLAKLLAQERGVRNLVNVPNLTLSEIRLWARAHYRRTGKWPTHHSGAISEAPDETWLGVDAALRNGGRGLKGGSSLCRLLAKHRYKRNHYDLPPLSKKKILAWADAHHKRTGQWPNADSGLVMDAPGENWNALDNALRQGTRTLPGGSSLRQLLAQKRGVRNPRNLPPLTEEQIAQWAQHHWKQTGKLPTQYSGPVLLDPNESWAAVNNALRFSKRGLTTAMSLTTFLRKLWPHGGTGATGYSAIPS
jgi:hypothetical protein